MFQRPGEGRGQVRIGWEMAEAILESDHKTQDLNGVRVGAIVKKTKGEKERQEGGGKSTHDSPTQPHGTPHIVQDEN